jgi:biopolymer transport protein ExbB
MAMRRLIVLTAMLAMILAAAAVAQSGGADPAVRAHASGGAQSFASAFFISYKTDPNGVRSIELLGSLLIWFLLLLSVASLGLIGAMAMTNQRASIVPDRLVEEVRRLMREGDFKRVVDLASRDQSYFSQVLSAALQEANHGYSAIVRALEQRSDELTTHRLRRIEYLNVLGNVSPMIGLFGTVYGMILAFAGIVATGGNADPVVLAGGIGTALVTTFWGLLVAIPALTGYAIIRNKIDELTTEATLAAEAMINQFRPRAKPRMNTDEHG